MGHAAHSVGGEGAKTNGRPASTHKDPFYYHKPTVSTGGFAHRSLCGTSFPAAVDLASTLLLHPSCVRVT